MSSRFSKLLVQLINKARQERFNASVDIFQILKKVKRFKYKVKGVP